MTKEKTLLDGENSLLNEMRMLNIALKRGLSSVHTRIADVPPVASMVLHHIFLRGGDVPQKEIETEFGMRRSTASVLLRKLQESGYIIREASETDGRGKRIFLSDKAKAEQEVIYEKFRGIERYIESALTDDERAAFISLCGKIRGLFDKQNFQKGDKRI